MSEFLLQERVLGEGWLEQSLIALAVLGVGLLIAWLVAVVLRRLVSSYTGGEAGLDDLIVHALRIPAVLFIVLQAIGIATRVPAYLNPYHDGISRAWAALSFLVVAWGIARLIGAFIEWYDRHPSRGGRVDPRTFPMIRRATNVVLVLVAGLLVMEAIGLSISPLLAGLGIGGIAVALALQPLLTNVFASSYMLSDASIRVGDLIEVDGGPLGFVEHVGWRSTRIRTFDNNIVIMPNATLADSTVTNFDVAGHAADASVQLGVAYEEDLDRVERVTLEVLEAIREEMEPALKDADPVFIYTRFGDSNIDILAKIRCRDRRETALVWHEMIKRIHARYRDEGIRINYPARRLMLADDDAAGFERLARALPNGRPD